jgi:hypothetical protein
VGDELVRHYQVASKGGIAMEKLIDSAKDKLNGMAAQIARPRQTRRLRAIGVGAGVVVLVASALLSGCYYRGRPPEYGRRGYGHHYDRRY